MEIVNVNVQKTEQLVEINALPNVTQIIVTTSTGGGGAVDSVNGQVGVVLLDADDISGTATNVYVTPTEKTAITHINRTALDAVAGVNTGDQAIPTKTSDLINDGDDGNKFISLLDLPSNLILYPTTASSDVSGYFKLVTDIHNPSFNTTAVDVSTGSITTTAQLILSLATASNVIVGNPGIFNVTTIGNITRTAGSGTAEFFFIVYKRDSLGVETLITQSSNTIPVINSGYSEFSATALWNDGSFLATDRIVLKFYANRISGGSNPTYNFQFGGISPVRTLVPIPLSVVPALPIDAIPTDGSINAVQSNGVFDALVLKADANLVGTLLVEQFSYTGSQIITLLNNYSQVHSVSVSGGGPLLKDSEYTLIAPNQIDFGGRLEVGDYIIVQYSTTAVGLQPYYSQAQVDALIFKGYRSAIDGVSVANTLTITPTYVQPIPAGKFVAGDLIYLKYRATSPGAKTSATNIYIYINTTDNLSTGSPTQLGLFNTTTTGRTVQLERTISIKGATSKLAVVTGANATDTTQTGAMSTLTIDWTVQQYIIFAIGHTVADQTMFGDFYQITKI